MYYKASLCKICIRESMEGKKCFHINREKEKTFPFKRNKNRIKTNHCLILTLRLIHLSTSRREEDKRNKIKSSSLSCRILKTSIYQVRERERERKCNSFTRRKRRRRVVFWKTKNITRRVDGRRTKARLFWEKEEEDI